MWNEFKKRLEEKIVEIINTKKNNNQLRYRLERLADKYENFKLPSKPSFFSTLFKSKKYQQYQEKILEQAQIKEEYEQLKICVEQLETDKHLDEQIENIEQYIIAGTDDFRIVIDYCIKNNLPLVMTIEDKERLDEQREKTQEPYNIYNQERKIEKIEDVVLVHKTNYSPKDDEIGSRMTSGVNDKTTIQIQSEEYQINMRPRRNTVHFSVNHEVEAHGGGSWKDCTYAIIVPLQVIPKEKFGSNNCVDTFVEGSVKLNNQCYILCPKDAIDVVKKQNPNVVVIGYEGVAVQDYANLLLYGLGYPVEEANEWGFSNTKHQEEYSNIMRQAGYSSFRHHSNTSSKKKEEKRFYVNMIIGIIELIMNNSKFLEIDSQKIVEDTEMEKYLYYCDNDTSVLFNYYLQELGLEPNYSNQGITIDTSMPYCISLIDEAKKIAHSKSKSL